MEFGGLVDIYANDAVEGNHQPLYQQAEKIEFFPLTEISPARLDDIHFWQQKKVPALDDAIRNWLS